MLGVVLAACREPAERGEPSTMPPADTGVDPWELAQGSIFVLGTRAGTLTQTYVVASFAPAGGGPTTATSPTLEVCSAVVPTSTETTVSSTAAPVSAGEVSLDLDGGNVVLDVMGDGSYAAELPAWPAGETLSVLATGDEVPAFYAEALLTVPPEPDPATARTLPDGAVEVQWLAGTADTTVLVAVAGPDAVVECWVADDGAFEVPAADAALAGATPQVVVDRFAHAEAVEPGVRVQAVASAYVTAN